MPESKKLSELIDEFIDIKKQHSFYLENLKGVPIYIIVNIKNNLKKIQNQIDQKFEELKCECRKEEIQKETVVINNNSHKNLFTKTYIIPPETKNKKGESKIRTYSMDCDENCCLKRGIEFTYYDGKLITLGCLEHKYESYSTRNP